MQLLPLAYEVRWKVMFSVCLPVHGGTPSSLVSGLWSLVPGLFFLFLGVPPVRPVAEGYTWTGQGPRKNRGYPQLGTPLAVTQEDFHVEHQLKSTGVTLLVTKQLEVGNFIFCLPLWTAKTKYQAAKNFTLVTRANLQWMEPIPGELQLSWRERLSALSNPWSGNILSAV